MVKWKTASRTVAKLSLIPVHVHDALNVFSSVPFFTHYMFTHSAFNYEISFISGSLPLK